MATRVLITMIRILGGVFNFTDFRYRVLAQLCRILGTDAQVKIQLTHQSKISIPTWDWVWMRILLPGFEYEASIRRLLDMLSNIDYVFIDGGANIGYWSLLASENPKNRVIAIEPVSRTFQRLRHNCELNDSRFVCLRKAITNEDNENTRVIIEGKYRHLGSHVLNADEGLKLNQDAIIETVGTISLDTVFEEYIHCAEAKIILKLDIEGQEINALKGAKKILELQPLIIYEDHGKDQSAKTSGFVLNELGLKIFFMNK